MRFQSRTRWPLRDLITFTQYLCRRPLCAFALIFLFTRGSLLQFFDVFSLDLKFLYIQFRTKSFPLEGPLGKFFVTIYEKCRSATELFVRLLFSAHISYGKGKYLNQTGFFFFLQNLPRFYLYLNLRVLPIEFNPHKFSFVRYVFVEIFEVFLKNDENDENDPLMTKWPLNDKMTPKMTKIPKFLIFKHFYAIFAIFWDTAN